VGEQIRKVVDFRELFPRAPLKNAISRPPDAPPCTEVHNAVEARASVPVVFKTRRLLCRRIVPADAPAMLRVYGDANAMRWVGDGNVLNQTQCRDWIAITQRNYAEKGYGMFALACRASGTVIGFGGIVHPGGQPEAEIKYALHRDHWGQGLATEAVRALLAAAPLLGIRYVIATVAPENLPSQAVLLKAGMARGEIRVSDDGSSTQFFSYSMPADGSVQANVHGTLPG